MSLDVDLDLIVGALRLRVAMRVERGELVAVLGPNGAGKTTLLRCIAGLTGIDRGTISVDDIVLDDTGADVFVAPERRPVGVVFQDYRLFPHLSTLENVAFGLRARGVSSTAAHRSATAWLARVGMADCATRRPSGLSGGQSQRVALARALASDPAVLLLDEPLAALDAGTRDEVRRDLRRYLQSFDGMRLMVTHDPVDAYALADRIVVLEEGTIVQEGALGEITSRPRSRYVADLVGLNLMSGELTGHVLTTATGATVVTAGDRLVPGGPAFVAVRPQAISLHRQHPEGSARNVWRLTVDDIDHHHDRTRIRLGGPIEMVAEVTPAAVTDLALHVGDDIWASVKATDIEAYAR